MRTSGDFISPKWLRFFQVVVGLVSIALSIFIMSGSFKLGAYTLIFLASIAFIIIGIERIAVGIRLSSLKRSSRFITIGIGVGIVVFFGSAYFAPDFVSKLYVLMLGFGLLATGVLRIIDGMKNSTYERTSKLLTLGTGVMCVAVAVVVFEYPKIGFVLLLLTVSIVLLITGIQIVFVGLTGKKLRSLRS
ncbi:MAG TPA: hypothetical protein VEL11_16275 [Candidatus Bathyarchaeia archaeon]|nr:hypothetical protein [Candidatus Bathyarchaeia archaeon]